MASQTPKRDTIIGAIVLAFSHSKLKDVVGTDALRSVLSGQYRDLVAGGRLHLQPVWDLLADQPGFDPTEAQPPIAAIRSWQSDLGLEVELPASMSELSPSELMALASHCPVPKSARKSLFLGAEAAVASPARKTSEPAASGAFTPKVTKGKAKVSRRRPGLELGLAVLALLGLSFGGLSLYRYFVGGEFAAVRVTIKGNLPVQESKRLGSELSVTLSDSSWFERAEEVRRADLEAALKGLDNDGISSLVVRDDRQAVRASAQWFGSPRELVIRFQ